MPKEGELQVYLKEYETLRSETLKRLEARHTVSNYSLILLTGILAFISSESFLAGGQFFSFHAAWKGAFFVTLPLVSLSMLFIRSIQDLFLAYNAQVIEHKIAPKIHTLLDNSDGPVFELESHLMQKRTQTNRLMQFLFVVVRAAPAWVLTLGSFSLGLTSMCMEDGFVTCWMWGLIGLDAALFFWYVGLLYKLNKEAKNITRKYWVY